MRLVLSEVGFPRLEVRVGTGRFAAALRVTVGLDPSREVLRIAQRRGVKVVQGVGEALPIADASFEAVLFIATLCFLDDPRAALREAVRVLAPGGAVMVADIIADSPWGRFYLEQKESGHLFYGNVLHARRTARLAARRRPADRGDHLDAAAAAGRSRDRNRGAASRHRADS